MCALGGGKAHDGGIYAVSTDPCCGSVPATGGAVSVCAVVGTQLGVRSVKWEGAEGGAAAESFWVPQKGCHGLEKPVTGAGAWTLVPPGPHRVPPGYGFSLLRSGGCGQAAL